MSETWAAIIYAVFGVNFCPRCVYENTVNPGSFDKILVVSQEIRLEDQPSAASFFTLHCWCVSTGVSLRLVSRENTCYFRNEVLVGNRIDSIHLV